MADRGNPGTLEAMRTQRAGVCLIGHLAAVQFDDNDAADA
jgi:hypothetical protein